MSTFNSSFRIFSSAGADFTAMTLNFNIQGNNSYSIKITLDNVTNDDDIDEITQNFALVAQLGDDVPDSFACFQRYVGDAECFGRTGAAKIIIEDDDRKYIYISLST